LDISEYDFLAKLAAQICDSKISLITALDQKKPKAIANYGISPSQLSGLSTFTFQILEHTRIL